MAESRKIFDVLGQRSSRTLLGYGLFALAVVIPSVESWRHGPEAPAVVAPSGGFGTPRFDPRPPSMRASQPARHTASQVLGSVVRTMLAMIGTTLAMLIL